MLKEKQMRLSPCNDDIPRNSEGIGSDFPTSLPRPFAEVSDLAFAFSVLGFFVGREVSMSPEGAPRLLPAAAGKGIRSIATLGETRMPGSTKSSGMRPSGKILIPDRDCSCICRKTSMSARLT
jgi:hypothetical protein